MLKRPQYNQAKVLSYDHDHRNPFQHDQSLVEPIMGGRNHEPPVTIECLKIQHRMAPALSHVPRSFYDEYFDHESVMGFEVLIGMGSSCVFLDHKTPEQGPENEADTSNANAWEVDMVVGLTKYVLETHSYGNKQIAVVTPYTSQLRKLGEALRSHCTLHPCDEDKSTLVW